jgi:hypothetical protein
MENWLAVPYYLLTLAKERKSKWEEWMEWWEWGNGK